MFFFLGFLSRSWCTAFVDSGQIDLRFAFKTGGIVHGKNQPRRKKSADSCALADSCLYRSLTRFPYKIQGLMRLIVLQVSAQNPTQQDIYVTLCSFLSVICTKDAVRTGQLSPAYSRITGSCIMHVLTFYFLAASFPISPFGIVSEKLTTDIWSHASLTDKLIF